MQQILVTGGAGFIGSHSVNALLAAGCAVRVLDDLSSGSLSNLGLDAAHPQLQFIHADIRDAAAVLSAAAGVDAVLHLAAQVSVQRSIAEPLASSTHNVGGFLNVLDAVRHHRIARMVFASSAAVYGTPAALPLTEASPLAPLSPYGLEKHINEQYAALYTQLYGTSCLAMRYFNVYGPRQDPLSPYAGVISKFAGAIASGQSVNIFGDGLQTRDFVYVGDVARANLAALLSSAEGAVNVGSGSTTTLLGLLASLEQVLGKQVGKVHGPAVAGDIQHSACDAQRLRELLGGSLGDWQPTALATGLGMLAQSL